MPDHNTLITWATPVFFALIALEAWTAHRRRLHVYQLADSLTSLGCGVWTVTVEVFTKGALLLLFAWLETRWGLFDFPADSPWTWLLFFFVLDFLYYWAHRWSHEINFLWGVHVPHHQSEEYNLTTALRQGAFQDTVHWPIYLPMALLGCPAGVFITLLTISKFYQFWIHTRLIGRVPLIEGILNTPSAHRVHHAVNDRYVDRNHGGTLMIWDKLFGTWVEEGEACVYGVRKPYHRWNAVAAHFDWFAEILRDARRSGRWRDRLQIWFRATGWRPADVEAQEPRAPFSLADVRHFTAVRDGRWRRPAAIAVFVLAAIAGNVLLAEAGTLDTSLRLVLALDVTLLLLAMAWLLQPRPGSD
ncbi:MAG: sterol desaturase family protein [Pseudomonadota bacterium]